VTCTHIRHQPLEIYAVRKLVNLRNFEYPALFVSNEPNSVSRHDVPIFNAILWFDCLDQNVLERVPLQVCERKGFYVTKIFGPWVTRDCTANLCCSERHGECNQPLTAMTTSSYEFRLTNRRSDTVASPSHLPNANYGLLARCW
jgi:hypothetical protein